MDGGEEAAGFQAGEDRPHVSRRPGAATAQELGIAE
nr:MAG TPA: hypothetical protein [Caudoviricetes sp.]